MFKQRTNILNILAIISAVIAIYLDYNDYHQWFIIFKPLTTIIITLIALINYRQSPKKFALWIVIGLVFCLFGDIFLLEDSGFIYGLIAFLIGHILFSIGYMSIDGFKKYWTPVAVLLLINAGFYWYIKDNLGEMTIPVIFYMLVISFMVWQGVALYMWQPKKVYGIIALSAVLFIISDMILAIDQFKFSFKEVPIYNLTNYWASLLLLANSFRYFKPAE